MIGGIEIQVSTKRMSTVSTQPPKYPELSPIGSATAAAIATTINPTLTDTRLPYIARLRMSRPS